jgi:radical SAM superfamily enzyme
LVPLGVDQVKIHLLHILKQTPLASLYERGGYTPLTREEYVSLVADALELLPKETVIGRLTGDGAKDELLAPLWSLKKTVVQMNCFMRSIHLYLLYLKLMKLYSWLLCFRKSITI